MIHVIISDTHAPFCLENAKDYAQQVVAKIPEVDAIVVNGDILGIFSMSSSSEHKGREITEAQRSKYLSEAAPRFYQTIHHDHEVYEGLILSYVQERYDWCVEKLMEFSNVKKTIFNIGNHESAEHFLVLNELTFLTDIDPSTIHSVSQEKLLAIFRDFENGIG